MKIVPLRGKIFRANVESYIIGCTGCPGYGDCWGDFLDELGNGVSFIDNAGRSFNSSVMRPGPFRGGWNYFGLFKLSPLHHSLKYLYFIRSEGGDTETLRRALFLALGALNNKKVRSVAFNGAIGPRGANERGISKRRVQYIAQLLNEWEREKRRAKEHICIKQVNLVNLDDSFVKSLPNKKGLEKPIFIPTRNSAKRYFENSWDTIARIKEKLDGISKRLENLERVLNR